MVSVAIGVPIILIHMKTCCHFYTTSKVGVKFLDRRVSILDNLCNTFVSVRTFSSKRQKMIQIDVSKQWVSIGPSNWKGIGFRHGLIKALE